MRWLGCELLLRSGARRCDAGKSRALDEGMGFWMIEAVCESSGVALSVLGRSREACGRASVRCVAFFAPMNSMLAASRPNDLRADPATRQRASCENGVGSEFTLNQTADRRAVVKKSEQVSGQSLEETRLSHIKQGIENGGDEVRNGDGVVCWFPAVWT
jgi:hypothetical protein